MGECSPAALALLFVGGKIIQNLKLGDLGQLKRVVIHQRRGVVDDLLERVPAQALQITNAHEVIADFLGLGPGGAQNSCTKTLFQLFDAAAL